MSGSDPQLREKLRAERLAIACPMANERESAVAFVRAMLAETAPFKEACLFAVLDRVSKDGTIDVLREYSQTEPRLRVVWAPENSCVVDAYVRGYREALATGFEWILEVDAGFSHQPEDLRNFFPPMAEHYECIFGSRFRAQGEMTDCALRRRIISRGGTFLARTLLGTSLSDMTSGYEMFQRHALQAVLERGIKSRGPFFQTEIKTYCRKMRITEVPIRYRSASHNVNRRALADAFSGLFMLFMLRLRGNL